MKSSYPLIQCGSLSLSLGKERIISDVSLDVLPGEFLGIIGPNGAGKTTLLRLLAGLYPPDKGNISLLGKNLKNYGPGELAKILTRLLDETLPE